MSKQEYRCRYIYTRDYCARHQWELIGRYGGLHLHISDHGEEHGKKYGDRYSGGIEVHYRSPPEYMENQPPSHDHCHLIKTPCWHDGSSMRATEFWIPLWLANPHDHDHMFSMLKSDADSKLLR